MASIPLREKKSPLLSFLFYFSFLCFVVGSVTTTPSLFAEDSLSIVGVGDVLLGTSYPNRNTLPPHGGRHLLKEVHSVLKGADISFGNLEGAILNKGNTIKRCKKCYSFRMPVSLTDNLVRAGFDLMSIANNHIRDFGKERHKKYYKSS